MVRYIRLGASVILLAGATTLIVCMSSASQAEAKKDKKDDAKQAVDWSEKKFPFEMRAKKWAEVFEWLADNSQMPYSSPPSPPPGNFTFLNPKKRLYSLQEVFEICNELLETHDMKLVRREKSLTLVPIK